MNVSDRIPTSHREPPRRRPDGFPAIVASIIGQQVSAHAGAAIQRKVEAGLGGITVEAVLARDDDELRGFGLSRPKVKYIRGVAEAVAGRLRPIINQSVTLDLELETGLTVPLEADDLEQVVLNLLLNSVDAMPDGGTIAVRARAVDGQAVLAVTDDGVGMTDEAVARVFEPFYTTKSEDGTGLGLAVVYGHVTRCGGGVDAESVLGEGTVLTVSLPLVNEGVDGDCDDD